MEKELLPMRSTSAGTYRRMAVEGGPDDGQGLAMPEGLVNHGCERSLSDFRRPGMWVKRSFDLAVSTTVLVACSPVIGIIALAIKAGSSGPVFHNVFRTGKGFRVFKVYGFRTTKAGAQRMVENLSHIRGGYGTLENITPTPTRLGRMLRMLGLDMLPLFLNVWLGDLSLVGTRALPIQDAAAMVDDKYAVRFEVPAGIWGPSGRNEMKYNSFNRDEVLDAEVGYARGRSFSLDLGILWRALVPGLSREGNDAQERAMKRA